MSLNQIWRKGRQSGNGRKLDKTQMEEIPDLAQTHVTLEDGNVLVVKSNNCGKRKRDKGEEEGCRYLKLERKASPKFQRKLRLPENANLSAITAKWVNGMLTVVVEKLPPPPEAKLKTVEVKIS